MASFDPAEFSKDYGGSWIGAAEDISSLLRENGISGYGVPVEADAKLIDGRVVCDFSRMDTQLEWAIESLRCNAFFLGPRFGGGTSEGWEAHRKWLGLEPLTRDFNLYFKDYMRQVGEHLREKGWLDKAYLYLWDEPEPSYFDKVPALQKLALEGDPDFRIFETTSPRYKTFWETVRIWSVPFGRQYFDEATVAGRRKAGDGIFIYNIPTSLEHPSLQPRLWFWQAYRYGVQGSQLWNLAFYHGIDPWRTITPAPYPVGRDRSQLYHYAAGEAILIYPNPMGGTPCESLRLKLIKKGIDDFTYLSLYEDARRTREGVAGNPRTTSPANSFSRVLAEQLVPDMDDFRFDPGKLDSIREQIGEYLGQARN